MAHFPEEAMLFCCGLEDQHKLLTNNQSYSRTEIFLEELQSIFTDNIDKLPSLVFLDNLQKTFQLNFHLQHWADYPQFIYQWQR